MYSGTDIHIRGTTRINFPPWKPNFMCVTCTYVLTYWNSFYMKPFLHSLIIPHSASLLRSVPFASFLKQRSQSVTPYSCQVPEARVSFIALQNKFFQIISQSFSFFKGIFQKNRVFSIFHSYFVCLSTYLFSVLEYTIRCSLYRL